MITNEARWALQKALRDAGEGFTLDDVEQEIRAGRAWLVPGERSAAVLQPVVKKHLHVWLLGGEMREAMEMEAYAVQQARGSGFDCLSIEAPRAGWVRVLGPRGWTLKTTLVRDLS